MNPVFFDGCCGQGQLNGLGATDPAVCAQAKADARASRPNWSPGFVTCLDPFLSDSQKVACACDGQLSFTDEISKLANQIKNRIQPSGGGGGSTDPGTPPPMPGPGADSGSGAGVGLAIGAAALAYLLLG